MNEITTMIDFDVSMAEVKPLLGQLAALEDRIAQLKRQCSLLRVRINELQEAQNDFLDVRWQNQFDRAKPAGRE